MGCCSKGKKDGKNKNDITKKIKTNKVEKKKNLINDKEKKRIEDENHHISQEIIEQNQLLITENILQQPKSIQTSAEITSPVEYQIEPPSSDDNISSIKTLKDLQTFIQQNAKPISIVLFYGCYCPYSKRTISGLRQWARLNNERIYLYEVDVEQASELAEYYHVRTIPTIMAFEQNNLVIPIWQRTADNVLSSINEYESMENHQYSDIVIEKNPIEEIVRGKLDNSNNVFIILDPSLKGSDRLLKKIESPNDTQQEQYLIILDNNQQSISNKTELFSAKTNENELFKTIDQSKSTKSTASSRQSPYIWNRSNASVEDNSEKSQSISEYKGRMISQSALTSISHDNQSKKKNTWMEHIDDNMNTNEFSSDPYEQHIHLPHTNEIYYEKQYDDTNECHSSLSFDRFSTLTSQHIRNTTNPSTNQQEICILYLGPNRCRGFEDNLPLENHSSKLSLLTLKSHSLLE